MGEDLPNLIVSSISLQQVFKRVLRLPLAESVIFATARKFGATLWTQDKDFEGLDAVRYVMKS